MDHICPVNPQSDSNQKFNASSSSGLRRNQDDVSASSENLTDSFVNSKGCVWGSMAILFLLWFFTIVASLALIKENTTAVQELTNLQRMTYTEILQIPYQKSCDSAESIFDNISEGTGQTLRIYPSIPESVKSFCEKTEDQIWTVFQRRKNGTVDFSRDWNDYVRGFGDAEGEFWLGLEAIYQLTKAQHYQLRIDMEVENGTRLYAMYSSFSVETKSDRYQLSVSGYSGNATDALYHHNSNGFSAQNPSTWWGDSHGGWPSSNLNGVYEDRSRSGIFWIDQVHNTDMYLTFTEMKLSKKQ